MTNPIIRSWKLIVIAVLAAVLGLVFANGLGQPAEANPHAGQSVNVVIIGGNSLDANVPCNGGSADANSMGTTFGGCLPVDAGMVGLGFTFSPMQPANVSAATLAPFDTAVLNVASSAMGCTTATLIAQAKTDLNSFVAGGGKLIIYDSECSGGGPVDYSWLTFPFTTSNPGAFGALGTLTLVENNTLSTDTADPDCTIFADVHCIDVVHLSTVTDAVGDANVMISFDPNWCVDMSATNVQNTTGPVHTYAKTGVDVGLYIYNGLDQDFQSFGNPPDAELRKMWTQELEQSFNPSNLPCGVTVVGISLDPNDVENEVGDDHTVTATLIDLLGVPQVGVLVSFTVAGANAGAAGVCSANADCTSDANGEVSFTYTGVNVGQDQITACFTHADGTVICSRTVTKDWVAPPNLPGRMTGGGSVFDDDGMRFTHGFELHCDLSLPNNLEINWPKAGKGGNKFHLTELTTALCSNDPGESEGMPVAGFDTFMGTGIGRLNGVDGIAIDFTLTDFGEPGKDVDIATFDIDGGAVLVGNTLDRGNHQAHE